MSDQRFRRRHTLLIGLGATTNFIEGDGYNPQITLYRLGSRALTNDKAMSELSDDDFAPCLALFEQEAAASAIVAKSPQPTSGEDLKQERGGVIPETPITDAEALSLLKKGDMVLGKAPALSEEDIGRFVNSLTKTTQTWATPCEEPLNAHEREIVTNALRYASQHGYLSSKLSKEQVGKIIELVNELVIWDGTSLGPNGGDAETECRQRLANLCLNL